VLAILPETSPRIAALTAGLTRTQLHTAPEPGAWSVNDVLAHLRACHDVFGGNILKILAEDTPTLKGVSPRAWIRKTNYPGLEFRASFDAFSKQRAQLLTVLEPLPPAGWARTASVTGMLGETYQRTPLYYASWMAGHERPHLEQIQRIITASSAA
jgi:hypothetical protein